MWGGKRAGSGEISKKSNAGPVLRTADGGREARRVRRPRPTQSRWGGRAGGSGGPALPMGGDANELIGAGIFCAAGFDEGFGLFAELEFLDFAAGGEGVFGDEEDVFGDFVGGEVFFDVVADVFFGEGLAAVEDDEGDGDFAVFFVGGADDLDVLDFGEGEEEVLDFLWGDVFAAADDDVLDAAGDAVVAGFVAGAEVAGVQPAVLVDDGGGLFGHLVVALHDVVAAAADFALGVGGQGLVGGGVEDGDFDAGEGGADGGDAEFDGVGAVGLGHAGGGFGEAVDGGDFDDVHVGDDAFHDFDGADGAGHDAGAEGGHVEHLEHGVGVHGDEHGGDAVEDGAFFLVDGGEAEEGVEGFDDDEGGAVGEDGHDAEGDAETMEEGHLEAELVGGGEALAVADAPAVVEDVVVGEHDALGEAGGAGRVLHVDDVVAGEGGLCILEDGVGLVVADEHEFGGGIHAAVFFLADVADEFELGIRLGAEVAAGELLEFGDELVDGLDVVDVAEAVDEAEHAHVGLAQDVVEFLGLVGGVDGDEDGAGFGAGELEGEPVGDVFGPDADVVALADADGEEALGEAVDAVVELAVGPAEVAVGVDDEVVVGGFAGPEFELAAEGEGGEAVGAGGDGGGGGGGKGIRHLKFEILDWDVRESGGGVDDGEDFGVGVDGVEVVGDGGFVVDAVAGVELVDFLAVADFDAAGEDVDELLAFVVVEDGFGVGGMDVDEEGLHVAGGLAGCKGMEVEGAAAAGGVVAGEMEGGADFVAADDGGGGGGLVVEEGAEADAEAAGDAEEGGEGGDEVAGLEGGDHFGAAAGLAGEGFGGELAAFAELADAGSDEVEFLVHVRCFLLGVQNKRDGIMDENAGEVHVHVVGLGLLREGEWGNIRRMETSERQGREEGPGREWLERLPAGEAPGAESALEGLPVDAEGAGEALPLAIAAWTLAEPAKAAELLEGWLAKSDAEGRLAPFCPVVCQWAERIAAGLAEPGPFRERALPGLARALRREMEACDPQGRGLPKWPEAGAAWAPGEWAPGRHTPDLAALLSNEAQAFCRLARGRGGEYADAADEAREEKWEIDEWLKNSLWDEEAAAFHRYEDGKESEPDLSPCGYVPLAWEALGEEKGEALRQRAAGIGPAGWTARGWVLFYALLLGTPHAGVAARMRRAGLPSGADAAEAAAWGVLAAGAAGYREKAFGEVPGAVRWLDANGRRLALGGAAAAVLLALALLARGLVLGEKADGGVDLAEMERKGRLASEEGRHGDAAEIYADAARLGKAELFRYRQAGEWMRMGREAEAEEIYRELLEGEPGNPNARLNLALAVLRQGRRGEALRLYRDFASGPEAAEHPDLAERARLAAELLQRQIALDRGRAGDEALEALEGF